MPVTYILECSDGSFYVGSTWDMDRRLWEHNHSDELGPVYTRRRRPVRVVWSVYFDSIREAFEYEKRIQGWGRAKRIALIEGRDRDLPRLSSRAREPDDDA